MFSVYHRVKKPHWKSTSLFFTRPILLPEGFIHTTCGAVSRRIARRLAAP